jgi:hypothetical protein
MRRRRNSPLHRTLAPHVGCNATLGSRLRHHLLEFNSDIIGLSHELEDLALD